jgi:hypothetical protein
MPRRPDDDQPEPEGGRAAERLRDFLRRRSTEGEEQQRPAVEEEAETEQDPAQDDTGR